MNDNSWKAHHINSMNSYYSHEKHKFTDLFYAAPQHDIAYNIFVICFYFQYDF